MIVLKCDNCKKEIADAETDIQEINSQISALKAQHSEKCKELEKLPGVECAEPNQILHTMGFTMPNEILYGSLYSQHMKWYFDKMRIPQTWQER